MKKFFLIFILSFIGISIYGQNDTIVIKKPIVWENEKVVSKTGKEYVKYYAFYEGEYYETNKQSRERYYSILRFNGQPCTVMIISGKTKKKKILVL